MSLLSNVTEISMNLRKETRENTIKNTMPLAIAHLGPTGTYAELAALTYANTLTQASELIAFGTIAQTLQAVVSGQTDLAVVPVENSVEGGVTMTMDSLWKLDPIHIQQALVIPIQHALLSYATDPAEITIVHSHPQALAQCQNWLALHSPKTTTQPANSTTEVLPQLVTNPTWGAIASKRAAELYNLPILACPINDYPENCTRFLVLSTQPSLGGTHTSLAFSMAANRPGILLKMLKIISDRGINLSRIESRPTKRSMGEYVFFLDLEADIRRAETKATIADLTHHAEILKLFGSYNLVDYTRSEPPA
jgi:prephenate dehydratase